MNRNTLRLVLLIHVLVFTLFLYCLYSVFCIVSSMYIYSFLFCLYQCKDYCQRVTAQLQSIVNNNSISLFCTQLIFNHLLASNTYCSHHLVDIITFRTHTLIFHLHFNLSIYCQYCTSIYYCTMLMYLCLPPHILHLRL